MNSNRNTLSSGRAPSRLLILWIVGFLVVGAIASCTFFNLVREIVKNWNTTALAAPSVSNSNPGSGPAPIEIPDWKGVERVNILLLGIDERQQEQGPWRTDTMIVLTVDPASKTAGILSIPRDLWVPIPGYDTEGKINTAHFIGDATGYPGGGPALAMATVQYNLGIPLQYYIRLNFGGFEKLIDLIGGIDIYVDKTIDDPLYPDSGYGYEPLHIDAGWQHMDGALALKFARTRHTDKGDFDRARHQQQVILAVRDKVLKADMLPTLVSKAGPMLDTLGDSIQTNLSLDQLIQLAKLATQIDASKIQQATIDETMVLPYTAPTDPPQDVLIPLRDKIREMRDRIFGLAPTANPATDNSNPAVKTENAHIRVENGTYTEGLAARTADLLKSQGFNVTDFASADRFDYTQSMIVAYTDKTQTAVELAKALGLPTSAITTAVSTGDGIDIRVILGNDYQAAATPTP
jgi:LCP family protein required for cell wall assembly